MTESKKSGPSEPKRSSRDNRVVFTFVAALGVAVLLGSAFADQQLSLSDWILQTHTAPDSATRVHTGSIPGTSVHAAENTAKLIGFADLVAKVKPAVVSVRVKIDAPVQTRRIDQNDTLPFQPGSPMEKFFREFGFPDSERHQMMTAQGSGFFISPDGYAVTNYHVVDHAQTVQITTDDGKSYAAKVIGTDQETDLALLKVDAQDLPYVSFADQSPRIGDWVIAIGNPFGLDGTVTGGIVSAEGRDIGSGPYDYIQIDAAINRGNSGGPAFDTSGKVIGVNAAIYSPSGGSVGIGFDIPAATAKTVIEQLKADGHVTRGWIGVETQRVTADIADSLGLAAARGALVDEALPGSPAAAAGINSGDVITAVNGAAIKDSREVVQKIGRMTPGTSVTLNIIRNGEHTSLNLAVGTSPSNPQSKAETRVSRTPANGNSLFGLALAPASALDGVDNGGVVVVAVDPSGPGADNGLQAGDMILNVGGKVVSSPEDISNKVAELRKEGKRTVLMQIRSDKSIKFVALPLDEA